MAFQRTDPTNELYDSNNFNFSDSLMMDEILALLLQDHNGDEGKKEAEEECGIVGQHCDRGEDEEKSSESKNNTSDQVPQVRGFQYHAPARLQDPSRHEADSSPDASKQLDFSIVFRDSEEDASAHSLRVRLPALSYSLLQPTSHTR
ncbi:hypothetical protein FI667_g9037, partial [Globisporangium splendens]